MGGDSVTSLAPGFRFHPTDEELVRYYLKRKVLNKPFKFDPISVVDVYKSEPWDLPDKSKLKSRDLEWYFFSGLDKKYGNGSKTNRATQKGYWKTTGKDREVRYCSRTVGMKKTLVYHKGRAPRGERTNWVMHEYRLADEELAKTGVHLDAYVLCRIFQKSGSGPKNGEQYGAPFVEEEWEDDEATFVPDHYMVAGDVTVAEDACVEASYANDIDQKPFPQVVYESTALPSIYHHGESSNNAESANELEKSFAVDSGNNVEVGNHIKPCHQVESCAFESQPMDVADEDQKPVIVNGELLHDSGLALEQLSCGIEEQDVLKEKSAGGEYGETSLGANNFLLEEPFFDASNNLCFSSDLFLDLPIDLSNPTEDDYFDIEEYLKYFNPEDDNEVLLTSGSSQSMEALETAAASTHEMAQEPARRSSPDTGSEAAMEKQDNASSSKQDDETSKFDSDPKYGFLKQAGHMLGGIHAPPAIASEYPTKEAALRLHSASQPSSSVHVTASMIRISDLGLPGSSAEWYLDKTVNLNITLTTGLLGNQSRSVTGYESKSGSASLRAVYFFLILWILIFSVSFKIGTCIYTR